MISLKRYRRLGKTDKMGPAALCERQLQLQSSMISAPSEKEARSARFSLSSAENGFP